MTQPTGAREMTAREALEQALEKVRFIGIKSGVPSEVLGAMSHELRALAASLPAEAQAVPDLKEALETVFCNMDGNGDPVGAQPETSWEIGYCAGLRTIYRVLKQRGFELPVAPSQAVEGRSEVDRNANA